MRALILCVMLGGCVVHTHVEPPREWHALCVADPDLIVAAAMRLMQSPQTP